MENSCIAKRNSGPAQSSAGSTTTCSETGESYPSLHPSPNDLDAEGLVLSHALEHGPVAGLLPKHFYADANRRIYEALTALANRGEPLDVVAVARELRATDRLRQVGGSEYLCMLAGSIPATAYVESHAAAIRELWRRRVLIEATERLGVELASGLESATAWARLKAICEEVTSD